MKAVLMTETGSADVLTVAEIAQPVINMPTQVKIQIKAASVNPVDIKLRTGGLFYPDALPATPGGIKSS